MAEKRRTSKRAPASAGTAAGSPREVCALQKSLAKANLAIGQLREEIEELRSRAREGENARSTVAELSRELQSRTLRMEQQLAVARQFQRLFMPPALPRNPRVRLAVKYQPSPRVGGDLYDIFDMGNSSLGIFAADASGYGLTATLVVAVAKMALDTFRQGEYSPKRIMEQVNRQVLQNTLENQFLTAFLAVVDLETMRMKYVNAAHPCPVIYGKGRFEELDTEGLCCGMFDDPKYEERETQLRPGDKLLLCTRGLVEMINTAGEAYDRKRLHALLQANSELEMSALVEKLADEFNRHMAGAEQLEDLTLVGLEVAARKSTEERIVIPSEPMQLNRVESLILARLESLSYGERAVFGVRLAIEEAVINAIKHGNRMDKAKRVIITYSVDERECAISVEDEGQGFDPSSVPDPTADENLELTHGRGLVLIRAYMDDVKFNKKGNRITMRKIAPWLVE